MAKTPVNTSRVPRHTIQSITVRTIMDGSPDTSYIGQYSNQRRSLFDIDRRHAVDCPHNTGVAETTVDQLERAIAYLGKQRTALATDESPEAEVVVEGTVQTVSSAGLWGIESDSDESYFAEVEAEELAQLRDVLRGLGFSKRAIATAVKGANHVS